MSLSSCLLFLLHPFFVFIILFLHICPMLLNSSLVSDLSLTFYNPHSHDLYKTDLLVVSLLFLCSEIFCNYGLTCISLKNNSSSFGLVAVPQNISFCFPKFIKLFSSFYSCPVSCEDHYFNLSLNTVTLQVLLYKL